MINKEKLIQHLRKQGLDSGSEKVADKIADILLKQVLSWKVETSETSINPEDAEAILGFSFGFRFVDNGNKIPGFINERLADKVAEYYTYKKRLVYAQWEICEALAGQVQKNDLHPIYPDVDETKTDNAVKYLGTKDVLKKITEKLKIEGKQISSVLIVAHHDHLLRCVRLAKECGFRVATAQDQMPSEHDDHSGQKWTKDRTTGVVSEIISRLSAFREEYLYK